MKRSRRPTWYGILFAFVVLVVPLQVLREVIQSWLEVSPWLAVVVGSVIMTASFAIPNPQSTSWHVVAPALFGVLGFFVAQHGGILLTGHVLEGTLVALGVGLGTALSFGGLVDLVRWLRARRGPNCGST